MSGPSISEQFLMGAGIAIAITSYGFLNTFIGFVLIVVSTLLIVLFLAPKSLTNLDLIRGKVSKKDNDTP